MWMIALEAATAGEKIEYRNKKKKKVGVSELCEPQIFFQTTSSVGFKLVKGSDS